MDHNQLRDYICNFRLDDCARGDLGYNRVLLQLFGLTGHGKSAFVNSCKYVLDGEYKLIAEAGEEYGGLTKKRNSYRLTDTITIVDNRGYNHINGFQPLEIYAQLGNFLPLDEQVEWKKEYDSFMEVLENADLDPNFTDLTVPVFLYSVKHPIQKPEEADIKKFFNSCQHMTGIVPIVVLTYKTDGKYHEVEQRFKGFGAEVVFAVENYTDKDHAATRGKHTDILKIMKCAIEDVKFRMEQERNPKRERVERRKTLLRMANICDPENQAKKANQQERGNQSQQKKENANRENKWCSIN